MRDFLDGIPIWIDHGKEGGLDPLAMLRPVETLYQGLLEGLSSVTIRLRYYSFLNWWVRHYRETNGSTKPSDFTEHIRIGEALIGLISKVSGQQTGIAGDQELANILSKSGEVVDLQDAADRYLKNAVFFGVYSTQMAEMGILARGANHNLLVPTPDIGEELANAYEQEIDGCDATFIACCEKKSATRNELAAMAKMRTEFSDPSVDTAELRFLRQLLMGRTGKGSRRATCIEILSEAKATASCPSETELRFKWMLERTSETDRHHLERHLWMHFQIADSLRVAYEALLRHAGIILRQQSQGLSPIELSVEIASQVPGDISLQEHFLQLTAEHSEQSVSELQKRAIDQSNDLTPVMVFLAYLWTNWTTDLEEMRDVFPTRGHFTTSALEIEYLNSVREWPANEAVADLVLNRIVRRHLFVASRKLKTQGNNTFQFEYESGSLVARRLGEVGPASPRTGTAIRFMKEAGLLDDRGITALGLKELQLP